MALVLVGVVLVALVQECFGQPCPSSESGKAIEQIARNLSQLFYPTSNPLKVLVATDEEISDIEYVQGRLVKAFERFPWQMQIAGWTTWDSDDTAGLHDGIAEVEEEIDWHKGFLLDDIQMDILVAFTGQDNDDLGGAAHMGYSSILVKTQVWWTDDNTIQHELSHLFGCFDHCEDDDCVMSVLQKYWYFIWEDGWLISIWNWQRVGTISPNWCLYHYGLLLESEGIPLSITPSDTTDREAQWDGIFVDAEINPNPIEEINPPTIWTYLMPFLIFVALPVVIVLAALKAIGIIRKKIRSRRLH